MLVFFIACLAIVALIFSIFIHGFSLHWKENIRPHLEQYLDYVEADIGNPPNLEKVKLLANRLPVNIYISGGGLNYSSTGIALDVTKLTFHGRKNKWQRKSDGYLKELAKKGQIITFAEGDDRFLMRNQFDDYQVFFEISQRDNNQRIDSLKHWALLCLIVIFVLSFWQLRRMLRPIQDIKKGVKEMGAGDLSYRVQERCKNDLGELSSSINQMAADIQQMLDAKRQLLLAVSHELRSPLTRAKIATQMLEQSTNKVRIEEDILEMEALISEILETERMNTPHAALNRSSVHIGDLIQSIIDELPSHEVHIKTNIDADINLPSISLDEQRMRLLMRNIIGNATRHTGDTEKPPQVDYWREKNQLMIEVSDYGVGISAEDLEHITEPFYRADPSRTRDTGGFGIGLYLCKLIVQAHKGQLLISSERGEGTCVRIVLPVKR
jgi:signal transduction histidine kinase